MKSRLRWIFLTVALAFLAKIAFRGASSWSVAGFFVFGAVWYVLTWLRTRELDSPKPR